MACLGNGLTGIARAAYGRDVPVQLVWRTLDEFRHNRRYVNSVETNAVRDGVFMSQDPEPAGFVML